MAGVKLTILIDPDLRRKLKVHAARSDTTVASLVRRWVKEGLAADSLPPAASERPPAGMPPVPGTRGRA